MSDNREYRSRRFAQLVGLELKGEFAKHSISQTKVAEILGHSKGGYSKWINAKPSMPLEAFLNTCELIEADPKAVIDASYKRLLDELGTPDEYRERQNQITDDLSGGFRCGCQRRSEQGTRSGNAKRLNF